MSYVVKARARLDIKKYWRRIAHDNLEAADRFLIAAEETFSAIARNPDIGSQRSFRSLVGVRSWPVKGFEKYLIFYKKRDGTVVVGRVIHGMRDLPRFF